MPREQEQIDLARALCRVQFPGAPYLWDAELDGGGEKNAKGESSKRRAVRHSVAAAICAACPERKPCNLLGRSDSGREGIYGGELV